MCFFDRFLAAAGMLVLASYHVLRGFAAPDIKFAAQTCRFRRVFCWLVPCEQVIVSCPMCDESLQTTNQMPFASARSTNRIGVCHGAMVAGEK
jgi:hypothetical protein